MIDRLSLSLMVAALVCGCGRPSPTPPMRPPPAESSRMTMEDREQLSILELQRARDALSAGDDETATIILENIIEAFTEHTAAEEAKLLLDRSSID